MSTMFSRSTLPTLLMLAVLMLAGPVRGDDIAASVLALCANCHGKDGNSEDVQVPRIAGMDAGYLRKQLSDFSSGQRRSEVMGAIASALSDADLPRFAAYFATQKPRSGQVSNAALAERGKKIYEEVGRDTALPTCASCHQATAAGNARFPRLAGQHSNYTAQQLRNFKSGKRANNRQMVEFSQPLAEADIQAVAEYLSGL